MQLTTLVAQPPAAPPASEPSPFLRMTSILRGTPLPTAAAASAGATAPTASDAVAAAPLAPAGIPVPIDDAGIAAKLTASVASKQEHYLANQQLLGAISATLGARLSQVGAQAWAFLRGSEAVEGE